MGNAVDEVKDAADVVVADHDHGGIAEVVGMILGDR
jgi:hydroxymethylpyrimidine pyrophosphatase-like HAD family hydrolase